MADAQPTSVLEIWKPIPGYEGYYEASDKGRVRSVARVIPHGRAGGMRRISGRVLKCFERQYECGYTVRLVALHGPGDSKGKTFKICHLVLMAFRAPRPAGTVCCHGNGNSCDDRLANLRWDTVKGNAADSARHGTQPRGARHGRARLTESQVRRIKEKYWFDGWRSNVKELAEEFGVSKSAIVMITHGRRWAHCS